MHLDDIVPEHEQAFKDAVARDAAAAVGAEVHKVRVLALQTTVEDR